MFTLKCEQKVTDMNGKTYLIMSCQGKKKNEVQVNTKKEI